MRTDFCALLRLLELLKTRHESSRTRSPADRNLFGTGRGRMALQPSLLFLESRSARQHVGGTTGRRPSRRDLGT